MKDRAAKWMKLPFLQKRRKRSVMAFAVQNMPFSWACTGLCRFSDYWALTHYNLRCYLETVSVKLWSGELPEQCDLSSIVCQNRPRGFELRMLEWAMYLKKKATTDVEIARKVNRSKKIDQKALLVKASIRSGSEGGDGKWECLLWIVQLVKRKGFIESVKHIVSQSEVKSRVKQGFSRTVGLLVCERIEKNISSDVTHRWWKVGSAGNVLKIHSRRWRK